MEQINDDRREVEESARRGDYLAGGYSVNTHIALLTRDVQVLIERVKETENQIRELEKAKPAQELVDLLESHRRQQWFMKRIWAFLAAGPLMFGFWQVGQKIVEWIRGQ